MKRMKIVLVVTIVIVVIVGIGFSLNSDHTNPSVFVAQLLIDTDTFPDGWAHNRDAPQNLFEDSLINHVFRSWGQINGGSGSAYQDIERSKNSLQAYINYRATLNSQLYFQKDPEKYLIEFHKPNEIEFTGEFANNSILLCGWYEWSYCEYIAQYKNYVVHFYAELEMDYQGHHTDGLTFTEFERILYTIDKKFAPVQ